MDTFNFGTGRARPASEPSIEIPTRCPACQSAAISTAAATADVNAYWRCAACGEVWNAARRAAATSAHRPWR
jgi:transposase-like protein